MAYTEQTSMNPVDAKDAPDLGEIIRSALAEWRGRQMQLPYLLAAVGIDGVTLVARYDDDGDGGLDATILVDPKGPEFMALPINMMLIDASGEAARISITRTGTTFH